MSLSVIIGLRIWVSEVTSRSIVIRLAAPPYAAHTVDRSAVLYKKAVLPQGNRAKPNLFSSV